jgi:hypothetical protein
MKKTGIELIAIERQEQIEKHGRTIETDWNENKAMQLSSAAACLIHKDITTARKRLTIMPTDWDDNICIKMCRKEYKERLIIAGALIAAEIDRLQYDEKITKPKDK